MIKRNASGQTVTETGMILSRRSGSQRMEWSGCLLPATDGDLGVPEGSLVRIAPQARKPGSQEAFPVDLAGLCREQEIKCLWMEDS